MRATLARALQRSGRCPHTRDLLLLTSAGTSPRFYAQLGDEIGGRWLGAWVAFGTVLSNVGLFHADMSTSSFMLLGMAQRGMIPRFFARRSVHGTSIVGILIITSGILFVTAILNFEEAVELVNLLYCVGIVLEFGAFLWLRRNRPDAERPFRVPLGFWGCVALLVPSVTLMMVVAYFAATKSFIVCGSVIVCGYVMWLATVKARRSARSECSIVRDRALLCRSLTSAPSQIRKLVHYSERCPHRRDGKK